MLTTTPDLIRDAVVTKIESIGRSGPPSSYPGYSQESYLWDYADEGSVQGKLRRFRIDTSGAVPQQDDPLHSRGEQYSYTLHVVTGYEGLPPQDVQIVTSDGVDLRKATDPLIGSLEGLLRFRLDGIEVESFADDGRLVQATFVFSVDYLHDTGLGN